MPERPVPPHDHTRFSRGGRLTTSAIAGLTTSSSGDGDAGSGGGGGVTDHGALSGLTADHHTAYATVTAGGGETISTVAAAGSTETIDPATANIHDITLTADCTVTLTAPNSGVGCGLTLLLRQDGTGGWEVTWPGSVEWGGGSAPVLSVTPGDVDVVTLATVDGGTTWFGFHATGAAAPTFATPAIVLGTAAAAGAASTVIRSDSTIVAFDATVPVTQAMSDVAATGSAAVAARRDHRHGMPASSSGIGEILISDTPSTPLVFADLLQNEAQDDLLYADP